MATVTVRSIVDDVDDASAFYSGNLGFGGDQVLIEAPSDNPVELFAEHARDDR